MKEMKSVDGDMAEPADGGHYLPWVRRALRCSRGGFIGEAGRHMGRGGNVVMTGRAEVSQRN